MIGTQTQLAERLCTDDATFPDARRWFVATHPACSPTRDILVISALDQVHAVVSAARVMAADPTKYPAAGELLAGGADPTVALHAWPVDDDADALIISTHGVKGYRAGLLHR